MAYLTPRHAAFLGLMWSMLGCDPGVSSDHPFETPGPYRTGELILQVAVEGAPDLDGVEVTVEGDDVGGEPAEEDETAGIGDREIVLRDLKPGRYSITLTRSGYDPLRLDGIDVDFGERLVLDALMLRRSRRRLEGLATRATSADHSGTRIDLFEGVCADGSPEGRRLATSFTVDGGAFELDGVPATRPGETYCLVATHRGYHSVVHPDVTLDARAPVSRHPRPIRLERVEAELRVVPLETCLDPDVDFCGAELQAVTLDRSVCVIPCNSDGSPLDLSSFEDVRVSDLSTLSDVGFAPLPSEPRLEHSSRTSWCDGQRLDDLSSPGPTRFSWCIADYGDGPDKAVYLELRDQVGSSTGPLRGSIALDTSKRLYRLTPISPRADGELWYANHLAMELAISTSPGGRLPEQVQFDIVRFDPCDDGADCNLGEAVSLDGVHYALVSSVSTIVDVDDGHLTVPLADIIPPGVDPLIRLDWRADEPGAEQRRQHVLIDRIPPRGCLRLETPLRCQERRVPADPPQCDTPVSSSDASGDELPLRKTSLLEWKAMWDQDGLRGTHAMAVTTDVTAAPDIEAASPLPLTISGERGLTFAHSLPAGDGERALAIHLFDRAGNVAAFKRHVLVDTTPPEPSPWTLRACPRGIRPGPGEHCVAPYQELHFTRASRVEPQLLAPLEEPSISTSYRMHPVDPMCVDEAACTETALNIEPPSSARLGVQGQLFFPHPLDGRPSAGVAYRVEALFIDEACNVRSGGERMVIRDEAPPVFEELPALVAAEGALSDGYSRSPNIVLRSRLRDDWPAWLRLDETALVNVAARAQPLDGEPYELQTESPYSGDLVLNFVNRETVDQRVEVVLTDLAGNQTIAAPSAELRVRVDTLRPSPIRLRLSEVAGCFRDGAFVWEATNGEMRVSFSGGADPNFNHIERFWRIDGDEEHRKTYERHVGVEVEVRDTIEDDEMPNNGQGADLVYRAHDHAGNVTEIALPTTRDDRLAACSDCGDECELPDRSIFASATIRAEVPPRLDASYNVSRVAYADDDEPYAERVDRNKCYRVYFQRPASNATYSVIGGLMGGGDNIFLHEHSEEDYVVVCAADASSGTGGSARDASVIILQ